MTSHLVVFAICRKKFRNLGRLLQIRRGRRSVPNELAIGTKSETTRHYHCDSQLL